jgi:diguanylate cyclase (GGDEF)-like protein/PAS domain S-box-containing protein
MAHAVGQLLHGFILTDASGAILYMNHAVSLTTGYLDEEVLGHTPRIFQSGKHEAGFYEKMWRSIRESGHWQGEVWNRHKNGQMYAEWLCISTIVDDAGNITHYCGLFSDITERKQQEQKLKAENRRLEKLSMVDALTGIANRRAFDQCLEREWERGIRSEQPLSLLLIDIDHFKLYNDLNGHQKGDEVLRQVASLLEGSIERAGDFLARYGGEEFGVILPETELKVAVIIAQSLRDSVWAAKIPHHGLGAGPFLSISVGCCTMLPSGGGRCDDLLQSADKALYSAKERGRNRVQIRA